jgi:hypothetical protein
MHIAGTALLAGRQSRVNEGGYYRYIITAKHVIDNILKYSSDENIHPRFNNKGGGTEIFKIPLSSWRSHPTDQSVDLVSLEFNENTINLDHLFLPLEYSMNNEAKEEHELGLGDEVFITGLFKPLTVAKRDISVVRSGIISAMPEERVPVRWSPTGDIEAYLIEARSIGGLSGSPVFVHFGHHRRIEGQIKKAGSEMYFLLGLIHGHYDIKVGRSEIIPEGQEATEAINMGIAIVVPVDRILEVVDQRSFAEQRLAADEAFVRSKSRATSECVNLPTIY